MNIANPRKLLLLTVVALLALMALYQPAGADPSNYPQFAQQKPLEKSKLSFISIDELVVQVKAGKKPMIVDVRTAAEYREAHILSAQSAPLAEFKDHLASIPKDRLVVLY